MNKNYIVIIHYSFCSISVKKVISNINLKKGSVVFDLSEYYKISS